MKKINDGGPAFPTNRVNMHGEVVPDEEGMTLRDYFAAKAMQGMFAADTDQSVMPIERKAAEAYAMADAMLAAREGGDA